MLSDALINPYGVDPRLELPHDIVQAENWTEYHYFFAYDPDQDLGITIHIGRLAGDLQAWRGLLYVFMPDGSILAHKLAGRGGTDRGPGCGGFKASCITPFRLWTLEFDGVLQRIAYEPLMRGVMPDGTDTHVKFHIRLGEAMPLFAFPPKGPEDASWRHHHHEQMHTMEGEFEVDGQRLSLKGMGARDHSSGQRDYAPFLGAYWAQVLFPSGRALNVTMVSRMGADLDTSYVTADSRFGYVYWGDGSPLEEVELLECQDIPRANTPPGSVLSDPLLDPERQAFDMVIKSSRGTHRISIERFRAIASTYVPPHGEIGGTDFSKPDALQQAKTVMRATWDGETGHGMSDCVTRIKFLKQPG